jgi:cobalt/nickel transport system ATP-binding protein
MTRAAVDVRGLRFSYPDGRAVLNDLDLHVDEGERVAVLGPNGAGKTTLALHFNGILRPAQGTIRIGELELSDDTVADIRRRVGLVFQDPNDQLFMPTVGEDVAFGPANLGLSGEELDHRVAEALSAVEASEMADRAPHHLSDGERRRVAIATVLAMRPDVLVLDEPSSGLDPAGRRELVATLQDLDMTHLVITHDLPLAIELCDRAVIIDDGRIVADAPTLDLLSDEATLEEHRLELPYGFQIAGVETREP